MKPLFLILSPRDIPQVIESLKQCPFDKLWIKYHPSWWAHRYGKQMFLSHKEYSHLVLWADDLIYDHQVMMRLFSYAARYPLTTGIANVDMDGHKEEACITKNLPAINREYRLYNWYRMDELDHGSMFVKHSGMAAAVIERELVERLSFDGDDMGHAQDVIISHELDKMGLRILAVTGCRFLHLRHGGEIMNGRKEAFTKWDIQSRN